MEDKFNKRERHKAVLSPFEYYPRIEALDFNAISEGDSFYLQDFGIFNNPLDQEEYALRLRISAGRIDAENLIRIAQIAQRHSLDIIVTARAGIQLHGLNGDNVLDVYKQINALGISTWQTFGDNVRNIVTDVYDGLGEFSVIETFPLIRQMENYFLKTPHLVGMLPRRLSTGISGTSANVTSFFANDLYFALAQKGEQLGFNVYMGGKNTEIARSADIFLPPDAVLAFFAAFVETFNRYGSRSARARTRLYYLLEDIGLDTFKSYIAQEYRTPWESEGALLLEKRRFETFERLKNGEYAFCYETDFGRVRPDELIRIATYAQEHRAKIRLSTDHNIYLFGLPVPEVPFENLKESATIVACAGSHYCPYSFWNIKDEASLLPLSLIRKHRIQIGISGCAKGCSRHQHSDIGLIGLRTGNFGEIGKGARIYIGAEHTRGQSVGRELFDMVPLDSVSTVVELIIREFELSGYPDFESFSIHLLNPHSIAFLSLWFLAKLHTGSPSTLSTVTRSNYDSDDERFKLEKEALTQCFGDEAFISFIDESFEDALRQWGKQIWAAPTTPANIDPKIKRLLTATKYWER